MISDEIVYLDTKTNSIITQRELWDGFNRFPEEIKWGDYCGAFDEYEYLGIECGRIVKYDKIYSPEDIKQFINIREPDIPTNREDFEELLDKYGYWTYTLDDYSVFKDWQDENDGILIQFSDGVFIVEVPQIDKEEENTQTEQKYKYECSIRVDPLTILTKAFTPEDIVKAVKNQLDEEHYVFGCILEDIQSNFDEDCIDAIRKNIEDIEIAQYMSVNMDEIGIDYDTTAEISNAKIIALCVPFAIDVEKLLKDHPDISMVNDIDRDID